MASTDLVALIDRPIQREQFAAALGGATPAIKAERAERFARVCLTAVRKEPKLLNCKPASVLGCMMSCASLDLEPCTPQGLAYIIPYGTEATFVLGYRGLLQLMYRSGAISSLNADVVYRAEVEHGTFVYESGTHPCITHKINLLEDFRSGGDSEIVAAYASAVLKTGEPVFRVMPRKDIDKIMNKSGGRYGPSPIWRENYAQMAIKTVIRRLCNWLPSIDMKDAFRAFDYEDNGVINVDTGESKVRIEQSLTNEELNDLLSGEVTLPDKNVEEITNGESE